MQSLLAIWAWVLAHPAYILLAWPLVTGLVNLAFGAADKYAEKHPRFHVALALLEDGGLNVRGVLASLAKALKLAPKGPGAIAVLLLAIVWTMTAVHDVRVIRTPTVLPVLSLEACSGDPTKDAQTANDVNNWINGFLNTAQYACTQTSPLTSAPALAIACGIVATVDKLAPAVEHFLETLILGREAQLAKGHRFDKMRAIWVGP